MSRLQFKLLAILIPLITAPLAGIGWVAYTMQQTVVLEAYADEDTASLSNFGSRMQQMLDTSATNLDLFSESELLQRYLLTVDEETRYSLLQPAVLNLLSSYQRAYPDYYELRLLLPDGYEDTRATVGVIPNRSEYEAQSPWFQALRTSSGSVFRRVLTNPDNGELALLAAKPIILRDRAIDRITAPSTLRGYLAATISLNRVIGDLEQVNNERDTLILLVDHQSNVLMAPGRYSGPPRLDAGFREQLANAASRNSLIETTLSDKPYYAQRVVVEDGGLELYSLRPAGTVHAPLIRLGLMVGALTLLITIAATTMAVFGIRRQVLDPIDRLRAVAEEFGQGNLDATIVIGSRDEIGELATAFRQMGRDLQKSRDQISHLAYHDSLTGLPNRLMFREYLTHALAHCDREHQKLVLIFLDLDNFKQVNDCVGHHAGDRLLQTFSERIRAALRSEDYLSRSTVARLGGDEFLILLTGLSSREDAETVADRIVAQAKIPFEIDESEFSISTSAGLTMFPDDGEDVDLLIRNADAAMYQAKAVGKNTWRWYSHELNQRIQERVNIESALRYALEREELSLIYQVQVDTNTRELVGVEALLRWTHFELGTIPPAKFIPIAEETGLIVPISEWVLHAACQQARAWQDQGLPALNISVNISNVQVDREHVASMVKTALNASGLEAKYLTLELTETSIMESPARAAEMLDEIKALGASVALDDFGTGYSSLSHLRRFPIDHLKIDQTFVSELTENEDDDAIVHAIIAMGRTLQMHVIAEGVETEEQLASLRGKGCHLAQGFLFGRPESARAIADRLATSTTCTLPILSQDPGGT